MSKTLIITVAVAMISFSSVSAAEYMTGSQLKEAYENKTFDIRNLEIGKDLKAYNDGNGFLHIRVPWKNKVFKRKWWIKNNQSCNTNPKEGVLCRDIKDMGNGIHHGFLNGKHDRILSNIREGRDSDI